MQFGPKVRQHETSRVWFPSLPLSSISLNSPTWLVSCMFVMSSTQKGFFMNFLNLFFGGFFQFGPTVCWWCDAEGGDVVGVAAGVHESRGA